MTSKLGPHFLHQMPASTTRWFEALCPIYKFYGTWGAAKDAPANSLKVGIRAQIPWDAKALLNQGKTPVEAAKINFEANRSGYIADAAVDVWEFCNELTFDSPQQWSWFCDYTIAFLKLLESIGKKGAAFSFAVGTPELADWQHLLPSISYARDHGHYLALHEYMAADPTLGVGWKQVKEGEMVHGPWHGRFQANGQPDESYPYGWAPLRYRAVYDTILRPAGLDNIPLLITELGCDLIGFTPDGMPKGAWTDHWSYWQSQGYPDPHQRYFDMLKWYDERLSEDAYVVGALVFTVGHTGQWGGFDIAGTLVEDKVIAHVAAGSSAPAPVPPPASPLPPVTPSPPPTAEPVNLLPNISFEGTWYHHDGVAELQIPEGYRIEYKEDELSPGDSPYRRPEIRVMLASQLPPHERSLFVLGGNQVLKIFKGWGAINVACVCEVALEPGVYQLKVPLYADAIMRYAGGQKVFADDPMAAEFRWILGDEQGPWVSAFPFGQWRTLTYEFTVDEPTTIELGVRVRDRWPLQNSGWFTDSWSLVLVAEPAPVPTPQPPAPAPQLGDARVPYGRIYHRVSNQATLAQFRLVAGLAYETKGTVGFSADDAGIGVGLSSKKVIEYGGEFPPGEITAWYRDNYGVLDVEHKSFSGAPLPAPHSPLPAPQPPVDGRRIGDARVPYARTYHRVSSKATPAQFLDVATVAFTTKSTVGFSADDAGIGVGLQSKQVIEYGGEFDPAVITAWYQQHYGVSAVEHVPFPTPGFAFTHWPTNTKVVTQVFGANPQNYAQFGLPGHEGVDIAAAHETPVRAVAAGVVSNLHPDAGGHNYGRFIRVRHSGGYETTYAHLHQTLVEFGEQVKGGQVIGLADNTGNSFGSHLHLTLKHDDAYPGGPEYIGYPSYIIDPSPFLSELLSGGGIPAPSPPPSTYKYQGPAVTFSPALHAPASDWEWQQPAVQSLFDQVGLPVKWLSNGISADFYAQFNRPAFHLARMFWKPDRAKTPAEAWSEDIKDGVLKFYDKGARRFELLNEPNLANEGAGLVWAGGTELGVWLKEFANIVRVACPQAKFYFPGMSPGTPWTNQFMWTDKAWPAVQALCTGFCLHAYTDVAGDETAAANDIVTQVKEAQKYLKLQVPLIVSEASVNRAAPAAYKARVYKRVEAALQAVAGVEAVVWYISSWEQVPAEQAGHEESWLAHGIGNAYVAL